MRVSAVILAAGSSRRFGPGDKVVELLGGRPVIVHTVRAFLDHPLVDQVVLVTGEANRERCRLLVGEDPRLVITTGGDSRGESSLRGLLAADGDLAVIHDGVRPLVTGEIITRCIQGAARNGAVAAACPSTDTIKLCDDDGLVKETTLRRNTWCVQTPQAFRRQTLLDAYRHTDLADPAITDDCMVAERQGIPVRLVEGAPSNIKITTPEDLVIARGLGQQLGLIPAVALRTGLGQDSHRFAPAGTDKPLLLGGVPVEGPPLEANSDGDVVLHALCNALSGVSGVNILGETADRLCQAGITDSAVYLREAMAHLPGRICHLSFSIEARTPRLAPVIPRMRSRIAQLCHLSPDQVGITATSGEGLSGPGRGEGIGVLCIATVEGN